MNRRDILKGLAALPIAGVAGCKPEEKPETKPPAPSEMKIRTVQILLEGAFAVVLQKGHPNRVVAFIPRAESGQDDLAHDFFFNNPEKPRPPATKDAAGYQFELSTNGLRNYADTYINPGFQDFLASTEKWKLPPRVATIILPFPNSINFGGRPLDVTFNSKKTGMMPTNHILEYYVDEPEKVKMSCTELGEHCEASPHCPPGVLRFFFGAAPRVRNSDEKRRAHAIKFFNFILSSSFPDLVERYSLARIGHAEDESQTPARTQPTSLLENFDRAVIPAVIEGTPPRRRVLRVSETVDCQTGGIIVRTGAGPNG
ncbi:MAG: hypothetical protein LAO76_23240 [Acidobacteriia bacterium]|nr:hypothetical protein [Terriglobia bacterium]